MTRAEELELIEHQHRARRSKVTPRMRKALALMPGPDPLPGNADPGGISMWKLAERLGVSLTAAQKVIDGLERLGLVRAYGAGTACHRVRVAWWPT